MRIITNFTKCGAELRNEAYFCHKCGTRIKDMGFEADNAANSNEPEDDFDRYFITDKEPEPPAGRKYYFMGAAVAGLIIFILCFCNTNTFRRIFYKPVDYYRYVEKKNALRDIELIDGWYKVSGSGADNGGSAGSEETLALKLSEEILTPASEALNIGDFGFLSDIGIFRRSAFYGGLRSSDTTISLKDKQVLTLDTIRDKADEDLYVRIPELGDDFLDLDTSAVADMVLLIRNFIPNLPEIRLKGPDDPAAILSSLPRAVELSRIMNKYTDLIFDNIGTVSESGRESLTLGGVEQKCWILTVDPDPGELMHMADVLRDTLKEDEDIKEIIVRTAEDNGEDGKEAWDDFVEKLDLLEGFAGTCPDPKMKIYVDSRGNIIYREIVLDDDTQLALSFGRTINGRKFGARAMFAKGRGENRKEYLIEGSGKKAGENYSGDFTFGMDDDSIGFSLDSFDYKAFKEQELNIRISAPVGDITDALNVSAPSIEYIEDYLAVLSINTPDPGACDIALKLSDAVAEPVTCTYSYRRTGGSRITIPYDAIRVEKLTDMKDYLKGADFGRVRSNLEDAGVPEAVTKYIDYIERAADYIDFVDLLL